MVAMYGMIVNHLWKVDQGKLCVHIYFICAPPYSQLRRLYFAVEPVLRKAAISWPRLVSLVYCRQLGTGDFRVAPEKIYIYLTATNKKAAQ